MDPLARQAIAVLRANDRGTWTRPSPRLYPHQWSWDAAFNAIGWAHLDVARAVAELRSLFRGQWSTGMVPHIVFDGTVAHGAYEPGPVAWATAPHGPDGTYTSGICQPPVHAIALHRVRAVAKSHRRGGEAEVDRGIAELYPKLVAWHRWLHTARDPDGTGLVTILHPWESGLDNSPRWDAALAAVPLRDTRPLGPRPDLSHVVDPHERPTDDDYRRYRQLVEDLIEVDYDQARAAQEHPFRVADVLFSAILAAADDALADLAELAGVPEDAPAHRAAADRVRAGIEACWDPEQALCFDQDLVAGRPIEARTIAGFAPLVAGCPIDRAGLLMEQLHSPSFAGAPGLRWALPPSTAVDDPAFEPRAYWRGPIWPVVTWILWWSLGRAGLHRQGRALRLAALDQLRHAGCSEYVEPFTGEALGSDAQSWTASVALDWLHIHPG